MKKIFVALSLILLAFVVSCKTPDNIYTITYHTDMETGMTIENNYSENEVLNTVTLPLSTQGYELEWYLDQSFTTPVSFPYTVIKDVDFYAKWIKLHTITLMNGTSTLKTEQVRDGQVFNNPGDPQMTGSGVFKGWSSNKDSYVPFDFTSSIHEDVILYAFFEESTPSTITVSFMDGNTVVETKEIQENSTVSVVTEPSKEGYTFKGWSSDKNEFVQFDFETKVTQDTTLYAFFDINTYTVTFKNGTDIHSTQIVDYNTTIELPSSPSKTGYTFKGWSTQENSFTEFNASTKITTDTTLYAFFDINTFTVTFKNGTTTVSTETVDYNTTVDLPSSPSKTGYTFKGWSTQEESFVEFNANTKITTDTTLYAFFTKNNNPSNTVIITFMNQDIVVETKSIEKNSTVTAAATPSKMGYTFKGWSSDKNEFVQFDFETKVSQDTTLYAFFDIDTFTVTFKNGTATYSTKTVDYNTTVDLPSNPAKTGYTFKGWSTQENSFTEFNASTKITASTTLYAFFDINTYTVTFKNEATIISTKTVDYNTIVDFPSNPAKTGYTFKGWSTNEATYTQFNKNTKITTDTTLYAFFDINTFTVTFKNGTTTVSTKTVDYNTTVDLPANPSKTGYTFKGWSTNEATYTQFDANTKIKLDTTLYAFFDINTYTLTYKCNTSIYTTQEIEYNSTAEAPKAPILTGYAFVEWCTDEECKIPFDFSTKITENKTLYARFEEVKTHNLTLIIDGEQILTLVNHNFTIESVEFTAKDGYEVTEWYTDQDYTTKFDASTKITKDTTLYGKYSIKSFTVSFVDGTNTYSTKTVEYNMVVDLPTNPTKTGYTFKGWSTNSSSYTQFDDNAKITADTTLYAFFDINTYTITFKNEATTYSTKTVEYNSIVELPSNPTKTGHTFKGWSTSSTSYSQFDDNAKITADTTLYAFFDINTYTITFKNEATTYSTKTVEYNSIVELPANPSKTGYTFKGWSTNEATYTQYNENTKITADTTLYAFFDIDTYTVTFKNGTATVSTKTVDYNATVELPANPSKTGYTFKGWSTKENSFTEFDADTKITTNTTLYAFFDIDTFTVTFKNGTATYSTKTVDYNTTVDLPSNPAKTGYTFKGWSTQENSFTEFNASTKITASTTLYAFFDINTYTVTFKNGTVTYSTKTVDYNTTVDLPTNPSKTGYTFKGWSTNETTYTQFNTSTKITSNTTLYAFFDINTFTVTFKSGTTTVSTKTVDYNTTVDLPANPSKTGYTFKGWSTNSSSYAEFSASTKITTNTTLYAFFDIDTFTVTFKDGNTTLDTQTIDYNSTAALPANPSKAGYTFKGWSTQEESFVEFNANMKITSNLTIYAYFVEVFTITFNVEGTKTTTQVESGSKVAEPENPTKSGYSFTGWYLNNSKFNFNTPISDNIELVARFEEAQIEITSYNGYNEGLYFEATPVAGATLSNYTVQYKLATDSSWKTADQQLIREQNGKIRCDIIGLPAGSYQVKIAAAGKSITISCEVSEDDRSGYAHFGNTTGVGAYNNDGTLKSNAVVVYVTDATKNTVKATIGGKEYTGLVKIIQACTKSNYALDIRILGEIQTTQWNFKEHGTGNTAGRQTNLENTFNYVNDTSGWDEKSSSNYSKLNAEEIISKGINSMSTDEAAGITKLEGLTNQVLRNKKADSKTGAYEYDSYYNMLDVSGAYNITIEGIGTDAAIFQWGFAFKRCNSIEIKNLRFYNYTEDAVGFEGGSNTDKNYGNYWVHNCTFDIGVNNWDVCYENDKKDGDGSSDVKYCHNVTISYVQYNKTHKTNLIGSSDSALQYNITLHHNYYNNCGSRLPLVRQTNIHMYNNYYYKSSSYSNSIRANCYALVENCYYEAGQNPYETQSNGAIKAYNNVYDNVKLSNSTYKSGNTVTSRTTSVTNSCMPDGSTDYSNFDMNSTLFYYDSVNQVSKVKNMLNPNDVPEHCKTYSGVLKANAKGFEGGSSTPINPDPTPSETWTNKLNETFSTSASITEKEYSTTPPTTAGIYYSYTGGTNGSSTNNNVSITNNELLITDKGDATTYGYYIFNQTFNTGKVRISIDFKPQTSNTKWAMIHFLDGSSNLRICTDASKHLSYSTDGGTNTPTICSSEMQANITYTIILTIDYDTNTATIQIGSDTVTFAYSKTISGIMFQTAASNARTFSVDNIKIDTTN